VEQPEAQALPLPLVPYAYDVRTVTRSHSHVVVTPKSVEPDADAITLYWRIGPVTIKATAPSPTPTTQSESRAENAAESEFTVQLTADQQVALSISGKDKYGNDVDVSGDVAWWSSDEAVVKVFRNITDNTQAIAVAVGPVGTAAVTVSNDFDQDGTGDFQGSVAIDVVAGDIHEITVNEGEISDKPAPDQGLPEPQPPVTGGGEPPRPDNTLPGPGSAGGEHPDNTLPIPPDFEVSPPRPDNTLPGPGSAGGEHPDNTLPGEQPRPDNSLPGEQPRPDNTLPGEQPRPDQTLPGDLPPDQARRR
jgi:hypothetical protein